MTKHSLQPFKYLSVAVNQRGFHCTVPTEDGLRLYCQHLDVACSFWLLNWANFPPVCSTSKRLCLEQVWEYFLKCRLGIRQNLKEKVELPSTSCKEGGAKIQVESQGRLSFLADGALVRGKEGSAEKSAHSAHVQDLMARCRQRPGHQ